jgi:hypothetical protein
VPTDPHISLGAAALAIFILCAGFILFRGMVRMVLTALILAGSLWVGFIVWQRAPSFAINWFGHPATWFTTGLPILIFIATFFITRIVVGFFLRPFRRSHAPRSAFSIFAGLVMTLLSTGILSLTGATLVHHFGSIAELRETTPDHKPSLVGGFFASLKDSIATVIPSSLLERLDPFADPSHLSLARLIAEQSQPSHTPEIDPETGRPYPRAIIVEDPELQKLARDGRFSTLLRHPLLHKALEDPKVQQALKERQPVKIQLPTPD